MSGKKITVKIGGAVITENALYPTKLQTGVTSNFDFNFSFDLKRG